ncbi:hypothetical protein GB937_002801 [Aspergillus fischeri]|nr:hypothetical protein GB937_002801 [Aspergillus fischeri]
MSIAHFPIFVDTGSEPAAFPLFLFPTTWGAIPLLDGIILFFVCIDGQSVSIHISSLGSQFCYKDSFVGVDQISDLVLVLRDRTQIISIEERFVRRSQKSMNSR